MRSCRPSTPSWRSSGSRLAGSAATRQGGPSGDRVGGDARSLVCGGLRRRGALAAGAVQRLAPAGLFRLRVHQPDRAVRSDFVVPGRALHGVRAPRSGRFARRRAAAGLPRDDDPRRRLAADRLRGAGADRPRVQRRARQCRTAVPDRAGRRCYLRHRPGVRHLRLLLGAVLTIAASTADPLLGAALLFTYSLGTAAPLFVIAWLWDRYQLGRRAWLRGRPLEIGPVTIFSTNLVAGLLFILLGASFIAFQGTSALSVYYDDLGLGDLGFRAQLWVADHLVGIPDWAWLPLVGLVIGAVWLARRNDRLRRASWPPTPASGQPASARIASGAEPTDGASP